MRKIFLVFLIVLLFPIYSAVFISIHELGHVALLRLFGDPEAVFYLVKFDENSQCLGCTRSSQMELSWGQNLAVSLGGLMGTQAVALTALFLFSRRPPQRFLRRALGIVAITFAFFDILAQVPQGLYYNLEQKTFETSVDLVDVMLLLQMKLDASQMLLKSFMLITAVLYLIGVVWIYRRSRMAPEPGSASLVPTAAEVQEMK